jgi:hypothetical protein
MRGLPPAEKALMLRIADLMDVALNNRQASNPFEPRRNAPSRVIYPITGLTAATGLKAVKLTWIAPPSDEHLRYEIEIRNLATGVTETKSSFTNNITYHGQGGEYEATVRSVGREGSSSTLEKITFDIGADVMQLEGAKLGAKELGTLVQDDILHLTGYKIFVWGAVVIDEYIAGDGNPEIIFKLWRKEGDDATFDTEGTYPLQLMETITLYPATEDASNLSADALGGQVGYSRFPVPEVLGGVRPGSFGTSQSVMFSPIKVWPHQADKRWTYFLQAINRETQSDEVSLSITIWAGAEGAANAQPGQPYVTPSPYNPFHFAHFHTWNHWESVPGSAFNPYHWNSRWAVAQVLEGYVLTANQWSLGMWWRPDRIDPAAAQEDPENYIRGTRVYTRSSLVHEHPHDVFRNGIRFFFTTRRRDAQEFGGWSDDLNYVHQMDVQVHSNYGSEGTEHGQFDSISFTVVALIMDEEYGLSALMPWPADSNHLLFHEKNSGWYFTVVCFEGSYNEDPDSPSKLRVWHNCGVSTDIDDRFTLPPRFYNKLGMRHLEYLIVDPNNEYWGNTIPEDGDLRMGPMYLNQAWTLHERAIIQDDKEDRLEGFGIQIDHIVKDGMYGGSGENMTAYACQYYQAGFWNVAIDNWDSSKNTAGTQGALTQLGYAQIEFLYHEGHAWLSDWRTNSIRFGNEQNYVCKENLTSHWQFGNIQSDFYLGEALRDTGWNIYGGEANMTSQIFPHRTGTEGFSPLKPVLGPDSWSNTAGIWDVRTPAEEDSGLDFGEGKGPHGTTRSAWCYPGQNLEFF